MKKANQGFWGWRFRLRWNASWFRLPGALCLLLVCSCATRKPIAPQPTGTGLPAEVTLNEDAGRGGWVIVTVRLESGQELPFIVDTGSSGTLLDKSLAPLLQRRPGSITLGMWNGRERAELYDAPPLDLGGLRLRTGPVVATHDFSQFSALAGRRILGCLGMDCLRHYCVQLDFGSDKLRFLEETNEDRAGWGKAFPLTNLYRRDERPCVSGNLLGAKDGFSQIDTGDYSDGWLRPRFYQQWTNQAKLPAAGEVRSPEGIFNGETYRQISLREAPVPSDGLGLHFLSRHLVTLDFPNRTMYLRRTSLGPLPDKGFATVLGYLKALKEAGRLPGWSRHDHGDLDGAVMDPESNSGTVALRKTGDAATYHYRVSRASKASSWKLDKAWQTDQAGHIVQEYSVP